MQIEPLGDRAYILRDLDASPAATARALERARISGVTDVVPCSETVGIYFEGELALTEIETACANVDPAVFLPKEILIPVCYELGADLQAIADGIRAPAEELVMAHCAAEYTCFAVGFCPGFAYLGPLPEPLRGIARLPSPRTRTEPGSVGLTGNPTAVYPLVRPGGWPIIGMTPLILVDESDDYFPIAVGDHVRFKPISSNDFAGLKGLRL
jgi:inhibitor of KinA